MSLPTPPCSTPQHAGFDFWIGEWELSWPAEQMGGSPGEQGSGTNRVERVLDGCVIQENFSTNDGSFRGHSVSVFDIDTGIWRQTWVDSSAGYIVLTGRFEGDMLILTTEPRERDGQVALNRMVFRDIGPDSLNWDWQGSRDGGDTWNNLWNIGYRRRR